MQRGSEKTASGARSLSFLEKAQSKGKCIIGDAQCIIGDAQYIIGDAQCSIGDAQDNIGDAI